MLILPDELRKELKIPLGKVVSEEELASELKGKKVVAVGDISTLVLAERGIKPFVAIFDFRSVRKDLEKDKREKILSLFPHPAEITNPPGRISEEAFVVIERIMREGGGVFVKGEEDLLTLVVMLYSTPDTFVVYGQDGKFVIVKDGKEKAENILQRFDRA